MKIYITKIEKEKAWEIRHKVMWPDKPFDFIQLDNDDTGIHLGLFKNNKLTSVISLFIKIENANFVNLLQFNGNKVMDTEVHCYPTFSRRQSISELRRFGVMQERIR